MINKNFLLFLAAAAMSIAVPAGATTTTDGNGTAKSEKSEEKAQLTDYQKLFDKKKMWNRKRRDYNSQDWW